MKYIETINKKKIHTVILNVAPIAKPIPSATNDTIKHTPANKAKRKYSPGRPLI